LGGAAGFPVMALRLAGSPEERLRQRGNVVTLGSSLVAAVCLDNEHVDEIKEKRPE
jgi:hypothetical protein